MPIYTRLSSTALIASLLAPQIALADITADDVWQNYRDLVSVFGGDYSATPVRNGNTLTVPEQSLHFTLPLAAGEFTITSSGLSLTEQGDGTVALIYPNPTVYGIALDLADKGSFSANLEVSLKGMLETASGDPGDITYTYSADHMTMAFRDVQTGKFDDAEIAFNGEVSGIKGTFRITSGTLVTVDSASSFGTSAYAAMFKDITGTVVNATGGSDSMSGSSTLTLPRGGMDIMNLAAAFRGGLALTAESNLTGNHTTQTTEVNGEVVRSQNTWAQDQTVQFKVDQAGIQMSGSARDTEMSVLSPKDVPFPIEMQMQAVSGDMTLPWSSSLNLQDLVFAVSVEGLTMADEMWALFDPEQVLPRDPATVALDMSAKVKNFVNWLDIRAVHALKDSKETPAELHSLTLNALTVDMAGARLTGSGSASFDNTDMETYGGLPKPTGAFDLALQGGNGFLDKLVAAGLLPDADATGARMMLAVIAAPDPDGGEDAMKSRLEITEEGHILANGQRLR